jgi:uncharacterized protein YdbL (DUF1318 family)
MKCLLLLAACITTVLSSCGWAINDQSTIDITLPKTYSPTGLVGEWADGYANFFQVVEAFNGRSGGNNWQSGRYFKITEDGRNSEYYFMAKSEFASTAIRAKGTIRFDVGSTLESGSFNFLAISANYKGWGSAEVDRAATESELKNSLSGKYYYRMDDGKLWIEAGAEPGSHAGSFRKLTK